jgi:hypothetical protein
MTGGLGQPDVSWDYGLKNLKSVKIAQIRGDGGRQVRALIVHRQQQPFDH